MIGISVFGLGYVGSVSAACLAAQGHHVIGVDVSAVKVEMIEAGRSPVVESGLEEVISEQRAAGRLRATADVAAAIGSSTVSLVCVGTPSHANGSLDLRYVRRVCMEIGEALATKQGYHIVVARSTMLPGSTEDVVIPALERASGKRAGTDFGVCYNPEFLREGTSLSDFRHPPFTVIGGDDPVANEGLTAAYATIDAPVIVTDYKTAEILKYASNAFHALKVTFANEIGSICKQQNIDSHQLMDIFSLDNKLNISRAYLRPGFAFGGSCLPKDIRALLHHSHSRDVFPPLLEAIIPSNRRQVDLAFDHVRRSGCKAVGVLGLSFKAGTDDLRESPLVDLIERLIGKGYRVRVYDRNVSLARLRGANREYIEQEIPHIASLMASTMDEVLGTSEMIVVGNDDPEFHTVLGRLRTDQRILDLVHIGQNSGMDDGRYEGITW